MILDLQGVIEGVISLLHFLHRGFSLFSSRKKNKTGLRLHVHCGANGNMTEGVCCVAN